MKKKITIISLILIISIQLITLNIKEIDSTHGIIENKTAADIIFSTDITYEWEWNKKSDKMMAYGLWTPSNASDFQSVPLIVYLHGHDGTVRGEKTLKKENISGIWDKTAWKDKELESFCAYILVPSEGTVDGNWMDGDSLNGMKDLVNKIISEYNIDTENIIICGHSRGGTGALRYAVKMSSYFSKCMVASPFYNTPFNKEMDTYCFFSNYEDDSYYYERCKKAFGSSRAKMVAASHGGSFLYSMIMDDGKVVGTKENKRSDIIEWMLGDWVPKPNLNLDREQLILPSQQIKQLNVIALKGATIENTVWTSSDTTVAEVDANGLIKALKEGKTTITAKVGTTELTCQVTVSGQLGDVDKDGAITSFDAYKALKASVDSLIGIEIDEQIQLTSDANKNAKVESEDAYEILKYSIGLINKF